MHTDVGQVPYEKKQTRYTLSLYKKHLSQAYHSRRYQVIRAIKIDTDPTTKKVVCPICDGTYGADTILKHVDKQHSDQMEY